MDVEALWRECGWRMHQLQAAAQRLRGMRGARPTLLSLLRGMQRLRAFVNAAVLLEKNDSLDGATVLTEVVCLVASVSANFNWESLSCEDVDATRRAWLKRELEALAAFPEERHVQVNHVNVKACVQLQRLILALREREQSREFHRELLIATSQTATYSEDNFAYGSTPFDTWARVCASPKIQNALRTWSIPKHVELPEQDTQRLTTTPIVVVGSSSGSLVFFSRVLLGQPCTGIEILPCLHGVAEKLKIEFQITDCCFLQADVLSTSLIHARLVVLTSQCWDEALYEQIVYKLERELEHRALVIDYRDGLSGSEKFRLVDQFDGLRVSWNQAQSFFIYERW